MSQGYIPRSNYQSAPPQQTAQPMEPIQEQAGNDNAIEQKNGTFTFAVVWVLLSVLAGLVAGGSFGVYGFNWGLATIVALSGLFTAACFFVAAAIIQRQNKIIEILKTLNR